MNKNVIKNLLILAILAGFLGSCNFSEERNNFERRKSPIAIAKINYQDTYVKIVYGQPYKKGREIFGNLVPYSEVWRTGANEATELTTTKDIYIDGNRLKAGTYALFTIPRKTSWTIILNSKLGQWGAFTYNQKFDVLRFDVSATSTDIVTEAFTITFSKVEDQTTSINLRWDDVSVFIPVSFITDSESLQHSNPNP